MDGFIDVLFLEVSHLCIYFWALVDQISDIRHLWFREVGSSCSHYVWLAAVTVCFSEVSLQFLHYSGKNSDALGPRSKYISFQFISPALEISLGFRIWDWFISRFLASVLIGIGGLPLVPVSQDIRFITLRCSGWF